MSAFEPLPGDTLTLRGETYRVMPHPTVPSMAYSQEARKALVFQLSRSTHSAPGLTTSLVALKKFKSAYCVPDLETNTAALAQFRDLAGMEVTNRFCVTRQNEPKLVKSHPDLEYAVVMPWIQGSTWFDLILAQREITKAQSLRFAQSAAIVFAGLEARGLAHCDISAGNVILDLQNGQVWVIDVEDLYAPGWKRPAEIPAGTPGYAHRTSAAGQWHPCGDRFAGAVLLTEMLCWHHAEIRNRAQEGHLFRDIELQDPGTDLYRLVQEVLNSLSASLSGLLDRAWCSATLEQCPPLAEWREALEPLVLPLGVDGWIPIKTPPPPLPVQFRFEPLPKIPNSQSTIIFEPLPKIPNSQSTITFRPPFDPGSSVPTGPATPLLVAPPAPMVTVSSAKADGTFSLWWSKPADLSDLEYEVEESATELFAEPVIQREMAYRHTSLTLSLTQSGARYFRIRARAGGGPWSEWSRVVKLITQ